MPFWPFCLCCSRRRFMEFRFSAGVNGIILLIFFLSCSLLWRSCCCLCCSWGQKGLKCPNLEQKEHLIEGYWFSMFTLAFPGVADGPTNGPLDDACGLNCSRF